MFMIGKKMTQEEKDAFIKAYDLDEKKYEDDTRKVFAIMAKYNQRWWD